MVIQIHRQTQKVFSSGLHCGLELCQLGFIWIHFLEAESPVLGEIFLLSMNGRKRGMWFGPLLRSARKKLILSIIETVARLLHFIALDSSIHMWYFYVCGRGLLICVLYAIKSRALSYSISVFGLSSFGMSYHGLFRFGFMSERRGIAGVFLPSRSCPASVRLNLRRMVKFSSGSVKRLKSFEHIYWANVSCEVAIIWASYVWNIVSLSIWGYCLTPWFKITFSKYLGHLSSGMYSTHSCTCFVGLVLRTWLEVPLILPWFAGFYVSIP